MLSLILAASALAESPVDLGVLQDSDVRVVQKVLYPKEKRTELGVHVGALPFDPFTVAPQVAATAGYHLSETLGAEVQLGAGYGLKTGQYKYLAGEEFGVAYEAYRYLASLQVDAQWSPIYAKMNLGNGVILHHDVYFLVGLGATLEQAVFPSGDFTVAPTFPVGVGMRVFRGERGAVRVELRDNLMIERRAQSQTTHFKQNAAVTVGYTLLGKK